MMSGPTGPAGTVPDLILHPKRARPAGRSYSVGQLGPTGLLVYVVQQNSWFGIISVETPAALLAPLL